MAEEQDDVLYSARYAELEDDKSYTTDRAELCAKMTLPYAAMEEDSSAQDELQRNYTQGFGAKLVNHLVGKFALSILPPSQPFYRLSPTQEAMEAVSGGDDDAKFEIEKVMAFKEESILRYINNSNFRGSLYPALRLAVVTGNCIIEKLEEQKKYRVINLRDFVIKRDYAGTVVELIIRETLDYATLPEDIRNQVDEEDGDKEDILLFTSVTLEDGKYIIRQQVRDLVVGTEESLDTLEERYIDVRWNKIDGEDYGRSFVEDSLGTFIALEKQSEVLNKTAIVQSKTVFTVNPNGMTKYKDFVAAKNGTAIIGNEGDIGVVRTDKGSDLQTTYMLVQDFKKELNETFLMTGASVRDSERTTAYEVQVIASEIEAAFGGIYTSIAHDIQMPLIKEGMKDIKADVVGADVDVIITSGVQALGRTVEATKINNVMQELAMLGQLVGQEQVASALNAQAFVTEIIANSGVASKNFIKSANTQATDIGNAKTEQMSEEMLRSGGVEAAKAAGQQVAQA